jgi:phosphoglycolate phosphatase-like HAD superfamily hydrolase
VALIAGQEMGNKREQLALATAGRYERGKVLMVGDALGDLDAASANGALFYPIEPGAEDESWERFAKEALPRFFAGTYAGDFMNAEIERFRRRLPETPPWHGL